MYWAYAIYPKVFTFDMITHEFTFCDLDITGANPCDSSPMIPWDLDEDGLVDSFDVDGNVLWVSGWPISHFDSEDAFHDNNFKLVKSEGGGWLAAVWQNGLKAKYANAGIEGYEDWAEVPEIAISIYNDNSGWSDTIFLNANDTAELEGMIPAYVYPGSIIEDIGNNHGKLHLMFYDDNSFGSSLYEYGEANGGTIKYASLDINFMTDSNDASNNVVSNTVRISQNFPNPFNPETTIEFSVLDAGKVTIEVYNILGEKIQTLVNSDFLPGTYSTVWKGTDSSGKSVSSGIYFYKLTANSTYTSTQKMLLLK